MHESIKSLLELHDIDRQRQILKKERERREAGIAEARAELDAANAKADEARAKADEYTALITQKQKEIEQADKTIEELRQGQSSAKTNKEYMAIINGIEEAKASKSMAEEKLAEVQATIDEINSAADELSSERDQVKERVEATITAIEAKADSEVSEAELDRMYEEQAPRVDSKFLEVYERLIKSNHPMPLMPIDANSRATPYGNLVSQNQMEQIRKGMLCTDQTNNAILYIKE